MESGWMLIVIGLAGAVAFFSFIWMMTKGLRQGAHQRAMEKEQVRRAEVERAKRELGQS